MAEGRPKVALFFASKNKPGLLIGRSKDENLDTLIEAIKQAKTEGKGIVFFLWANDRGTGGFAASMTVGVDQPLQQAAGVEAKPIQSAPVAKAPAASVFDTALQGSVPSKAKSVFD